MPAVVEPFAFPSDLVVGRRAGVACVVSAGDEPIHIKWLKDGSPLDIQSLGAKVVTADFTSSLSFARVTSRHRGNYSCVAHNPASSVSFSTQMLVQGMFSCLPFHAFMSPASSSSCKQDCMQAGNSLHQEVRRASRVRHVESGGETDCV